ncbi:MAG: DMT family transporter [Anaerovoracaceae bacterium]
MSASAKAYIAATLYATIVGLSFLGTKTSVDITTPLLTLVWRYNMGFIGALFLILFGIVKIRFKGKNIKGLLLASIFYISFMGIQTFGLTKATSIEASIIFAIVPVFVQVFAFIILKERTTFVQNFFIAITIIGIIILYAWGSIKLSEINPWGMLIILISSLCMALSNVYMRYARKDFKAMEVGSFIAILGCIVFNTVFIISKLFANVDNSYVSPFASENGITFAIAIVYLGIPCMLFTSTLITYALSHIEAVKGTIFGNLSLLIAIIAGIIIRNEPFMSYHFICSALIVIGVIGTNIDFNKTRFSKSSSGNVPESYTDRH